MAQVVLYLVIPLSHTFQGISINIGARSGQMNRETWKGRIRAALSDMADEQFQRRAWTGTGPEVSSLVEVICGLFDDALLLEYVCKYAPTLAPKTLSDVRDLDRKIRSLDTDHLDTLPVLEVIDTPQWAEIRGIANGLKLAFEQDQNHE